MSDYLHDLLWMTPYNAALLLAGHWVGWTRHKRHTAHRHRRTR